MNRSEIVPLPLPVELDGSGQPVSESHLRLPTQKTSYLRDIRHEISALLCAASGREVGELHRAAGHELPEQLGDFQKSRGLIVPDVENLANRSRFFGGAQERFDTVVDVEKIP